MEQMCRVGLLADMSALNPGGGRKEERRDSKKFECYGRLVKLLLPFNAREARMLSTCNHTYHACHAQGSLFTQLLQCRLQALEHLCLGQYFLLNYSHDAYLKLDLGLGDVSLAAASAGNLLCLTDLVPDSLFQRQSQLPHFMVFAPTSALKSSKA
jgi:hypothetical protein